MDIIVGGGKYGCKAIEYLRNNQKSLVVVDTDPKCQAVKKFQLKTANTLPSEGEYFIHGDLSTTIQLIDQLKPEYVFPTAPVHIAADMAKLKFNLEPWSEPVNDILTKLPPFVVLFAAEGKIILSFNKDNKCLDECPMPQTCPTSKITKPCTMTKLMKFASPQARILISYSMTPGMGALKGSELLEFFKWAKNKEKFVVGTACDCHGVFSAFQRSKPKA